jgi:hypothetical protein
MALELFETPHPDRRQAIYHTLSKVALHFQE